MKKVKLVLCLTFGTIFIAFHLVRSSSATSQAAGEPIAAPTGVQATDNIYNGKIGVRWDAVRGATSYRIFKSSVNDPVTAVEAGVTAADFFFDPNVGLGETLYYWVRAESSANVSPLSSPDAGTRANVDQPGGPQPLPVPPVPPANPMTAAKATLGKVLFWDEQMSSTRTVSCGSCHIPAAGGADPRRPSTANPGPDGIVGNGDDIVGSRGVPANNVDGTFVWGQTYGVNDQVTGRASMSAVNAAYFNVLFWDGRAIPVFRDPISNSVLLNGGGALESQAAGPPTNDVEMGHAGRNWTDVASRISASQPLALAPSMPTALQTWINGRTYPELFSEAFGTPEVSPARIAMAIATYERTLFSDQAPIDLADAGITPLTMQEQRGRIVFTTNCQVCHTGNLFTNSIFRYIGVRPQEDDIGREAVTGDPNHRGEFRTVGLRNVGLRSSFFHNGRFSTLEEVVAFYNRGGDFTGPNKPTALIRPLNLNAGQRADLVAFLRRPLTDPRVAAELPPFDRPKLYTESDRVPRATGAGRAGTGGITPAIYAVSPPVVGNSNFTVSLTGALGNANARLIVSTRARRSPNRDASGDLELFNGVVSTQNTGAGNGWASVSFAIPEVLAPGQTFYARWFIEDPSALGGFSMTPTVAFTIFSPSTFSSPIAATNETAVEADLSRSRVSR